MDSIYASDHCAKNHRDYSETQQFARHEMLFSFPSDKARALELLNFKKENDSRNSIIGRRYGENAQFDLDKLVKENRGMYL